MFFEYNQVIIGHQEGEVRFQVSFGFWRHSIISWETTDPPAYPCLVLILLHYDAYQSVESVQRREPNVEN